MAAQVEWQLGQIVDVQPRTWAGINRLGGTGKIVKLHYAEADTTEVEFVDVKYIVNSGTDKKLRLHLISPREEVTRSKRRSEKSVEDTSAGETKTEEKTQEKSRQKRKKRSALTRVSKNLPPVSSPRANRKPSAASRSKSPETVSTVSPSTTPIQASLAFARPFAASRVKSTESLSLSTVSPPTTGLKVADSPSTSDHGFSESEADSLVASSIPEETPEKHKLEELYKEDMRKAGEFVGELNVHQHRDNASNKIDEDMERFTSVLNELLLKNDGMLEVADIPTLLSGFPTDQVHAYVDKLCSQNKIMRTDGIIYSI